jgi:hypothetical protein
VFDPVVIAKGNSSSNYLGASELIAFADGSPLICDTKEALASGSKDLVTHGMQSYLNLQPVYLINSLRMGRDAQNVYGRMMISFPQRRNVTYYDEARYGEATFSDELRESFEILASNEALDFGGSGVPDMSLLPETTATSVEFDGVRIEPPPLILDEILYILWSTHRNYKEPTVYKIEGEAFIRGFGLAFALNENLAQSTWETYRGKFVVCKTMQASPSGSCAVPLLHHRRSEHSITSIDSQAPCCGIMRSNAVFAVSRMDR